MPSIVGGPIKIVEVSGGSVHFGDTAIVAPKSASKSYSGSGGGNTGDFASSWNIISSTNTLDPDVIDSNTASGVS